ncbi:hypothetical protein SmJEL517_g04589 [Synchytrium microbalum]|uniref:Cytochrome P450 n=1 Tax=Synchytrium microbalum TaxID=1806994 RepID=A0A507BXU8_9FUNG|nr:uncharacterized protein SmJEL517_g04589 [Synchytrium microbalum]TPX32252.1 hypothetical protein SmJEL517_g04589 [Synchytrium microbalum]
MDPSRRVATVLTSVVVATLVYIIMKKAKRKRPPGPGYPIIGDIEAFSALANNKAAVYIFKKQMLYGRIMDFRVLNQSIYVLADPDEAHRILNNSHEFYRDRTFQNASEKIMESALFCLPSGDTWHRHRKLLSPAFSPIHLQHALEVSIKSTKQLCKYWASLGPKVIHNVHHEFACLTLDVIGQVAFSQDFGVVKSLSTDNVSETYQLFEKVGGAIGKRMNQPKWFWWPLGVTVKDIEYETTRVRQIAIDVLQTKMAATVARPEREWDVLDRLLAKSTDGEDKFTPDEVIDELMGFYFAGHETTSNTISFAIMALAQNPTVTAKLLAEIDDRVGKGEPTMAMLSELKYLDNFVKEVQRLYTVAGFNLRRPRQDSEICGYMVPKDSVVIINIWAIHTAPWIWGITGRDFDPDRWTRPIPHNAYLPFGSGPMGCIGQKMALIELKVALITMLQRFTFELVPNQDLEPESAVTIGMRQGLRVTLTPR